MALAHLPARANGPAAAAPRNYARIAEQTWIWTTVGYTIVRLIVAWGAFGDHGVNVWMFGLIDVGTAWPYAKSIAVIVKRSAASEWSRLPVPVAIAIPTFFAPYAYLWLAAGEMPAGLRLAMSIFVGTVLIAATAGVIVQSRKLRASYERSASGAMASRAQEERSPLGDDVVIDLTRGEAVAIAGSDLTLTQPLLANKPPTARTGSQLP